MRRGLYKLISVVCLLTFACQIRAQVQVESTIDSIQILIGEQAHVTLNVSMKKGLKLEMPQYKRMEYVTPGVEFVSDTQADTSELDNNMIKVSKVYTLTSVDENLYYLPEMTVKVDGKPYKTKSLALKVLTVPVDTLHPEQFFPPKDVQNNPFQWAEWRAPFWLSILLIVMMMAALYLRKRLKDNKPIIAKIKIVKKVLPHQKAMKEIERLKEERMTSSENNKEYYTRLTDTLRKYIEERFGFNAMEMTSSEIIDHLNSVDDRKMIDELKELFTTADLVKFAKYSTLINENDANLVNAIEFINTTKIENAPTTETIVPTLTEHDKRSIRSRLTIKWSMIALFVLGVLLWMYIVYRIYLLI